jgi:hypothetical protein
METVTVKSLVEALDSHMQLRYEEYLAAHRELKPYSEKILDDEEVKAANAVLKNIQETFTDLYDGYHFILFRHQLATNAVSSYNEFIEKLKAAGAKMSGSPETVVDANYVDEAPLVDTNAEPIEDIE